MEDLHRFLEFQLPRQWAPVLGEIHLGSYRKHQVNTWLRFSILGPKLYINTTPVDVGNRPVTGLRLQLEGSRSNRLAIHLQHLASLPKSLPLADNANAYLSCDSYSCTFHKKVKRNCFSYVCTAPVESDDSLSIVTGAQSHLSGINPPIVTCPGASFGTSLLVFPKGDIGIRNHPKPGDVTIGSAVYPTGLPVPINTPKLQRYVDPTEMIRGPENAPGYWVVSGAKLSVHNVKIYLLVKYSLLRFVIQSEIKAS
ncbi:hypothetical protein MtrunA17_Chr8g0385161 [Medicago truncatula]|uniref:MACPF domain protein n=1 Tax=Medicago truncatula TaxID=3880 RepID=A0A396GRP5_MEDTR|nr:hypothetical protein MtrunA17_Chr8g0385161 [Medicago truncatula]